jgi:hypothetical protein
MTHEEFVATVIVKVCALAKSILDGQTPILDGAHKMYALLPQLDLPDDDETYRDFVLIHSETEHLPIGTESAWPPEALIRFQPEIESAAGWAKPITLNACKSLLGRFGA